MRHYLITFTAADGATVQTAYSSVLPMGEVLAEWKVARANAGGSATDVNAPILHDPDREPPPLALVNVAITREAQGRYQPGLDLVAFENGAIFERDGKLRLGAAPRSGEAFEAGAAWYRSQHPLYGEWSPARLAHALGYTLDLRSHGGGQRSIYLVGPGGKSRLTSHQRTHKALSRLARMRGVDPHNPPAETPRALRNGAPA